MGDVILKRFMLASLLIAPLAVAAQKQPSYICIGDASSGFYRFKDKWEPASADNLNKKFVIKPFDGDSKHTAEEYSLAAYRLGEELASLYCNPVSMSESTEVVACRSKLNFLFLNANTGEYVFSALTDFLPTNDERALSVEVGNCSKI